MHGGRTSRQGGLSQGATRRSHTGRIVGGGGVGVGREVGLRVGGGGGVGLRVGLGVGLRVGLGVGMGVGGISHGGCAHVGTSMSHGGLKILHGGLEAAGTVRAQSGNFLTQ